MDERKPLRQDEYTFSKWITVSEPITIAMLTSEQKALFGDGGWHLLTVNYDGESHMATVDVDGVSAKHHALAEPGVAYMDSSCQANICGGKHSVVVKRWWTRTGPNDIWTGPRNICLNAIALCHEKHPLFEWRDYEPDKPEKPVKTVGRMVFPRAIGTTEYFKGGVGGSYGRPAGVRFSPEQEKMLADGHAHVLTVDYNGSDVRVVVDDVTCVYRCLSVEDPPRPLGMPSGGSDCEQLEVRSSGLLASFGGTLGRNLARKMRVEKGWLAEEPSQPLGMQPSCAAMRSCFGGRGIGKLVRGVWRDKYHAADDWSRPMHYCEACIAGFLAEGIGFEWKAIDEDAPADVGQRPEAAKTKMETQTCTDCGVEVCVPPYLMEGRCCNCHEAQAQRAHKQWLKDQASRESAPVEADFETNVLAQTYCENAPPREIVESTPVMLDGDEVGGVPKTPFLRSHLHWNLRMKAEWERHEAWSKPIVAAAEAAYQRGDVTALMAAETCRPDHDSKAPTDTDQFGGRIAGVSGMRCKLCGGWIRIRREV